MNKEGEPRAPTHAGDLLALKLQQLHTEQKLKGEQALFRIDYRKEAAAAPFQFDAARSKLHRKGCTAIPESSATALFGLWRMRREQRALACTKCRPTPDSDSASNSTMDRNFTSDLFYGVVSVLDQFGNVLRERGREYRGSKNGNQAELKVEGFYENLGEREKEVLDVVLSSLDGVLQKVHDLDQSLGNNHSANGREAGKSNDGNGAGKT